MELTLEAAPARSIMIHGRRGKTAAPIDSANLRRSTRANKYDGFKVTQSTDSRPYKSKVKARVIPAAPSSSSAPTQNILNNADEIPPHTPIKEMQAEGMHLCVIPEEELTFEVLLNGDNGSSSSA